MMRRLILVPRKDGPGIISLPLTTAKYVPPPVKMIGPPPAARFTPPPAALPNPLPIAAHASPANEDRARPQTDAHVPLGVLVV